MNLFYQIIVINVKKKKKKAGRKKGSVLFNDALTHLITVIWRHTYGKGPLR